ncbi:hypothetical protein N7453_002802 [Penicillium expansum]|nr:hypothetical protein N7453_002802 [Penicillium expansum]
MTPRIPPSNGDDQWQWNGTGERDTTDEACVHCEICHSSSHLDAECPFVVFLNLRRGMMTFQRRLNMVNRPNPNNPFPRPGDSPVHRPPVPLAPRALRHVESVIPLLVPPHIESAHVFPSHLSRHDRHSTDGAQGAHSTTENINEIEASKGNKDDNQCEV